MTFFVLQAKPCPGPAPPPSRISNPPWIQESDPTSTFSLPALGHSHYQTICPQLPWLELSPLGAAGRVFGSRNFSGMKQPQNPNFWALSCRAGQRPSWAAAGHKSMFFPWNFWSVPAPQEGIVELRTPPGTGIEPQGQEKMGRKSKIPGKLCWEELSLWENSQSRGGRAAPAPHCGIKSSFCAGNSPERALGRCGGTQVVPSCGDSQEIWDLLSPPR